MTVTQVFFCRLLSPATGSQNHGSTLKWQAAASQSHLRTRCKLLGRSGDHWHLIILCKPLLRQYQLCKGEAGICPSSSTSSPGMANAASATWLISWAKSKYSKFQNPTGMVSRCLSSFSPLDLPFRGIWYPPFWDNPLYGVFCQMLYCNFSARPPGGATASQALYGGQ